MKPTTSLGMARLTIFTAILMASCSKSEIDTLAPLDSQSDLLSAATTPVTLLSSIKDVKTGDSTLILYNSLKNPAKILYYTGKTLKSYDSLVYGTGNRLVKVLSYSSQPKALQSYVVPSWNTAGAIVKKTTYSAASKVQATLAYTYSSTAVTSIKGTATGTPGFIKAVPVYNTQNNITKTTYTGDNVTYGYTQYSGYDTRLSPYATHKLLRYLLDKRQDAPVYNRNNALQTKAVYYSLLQELTTTEKNTYTYNSKALPAKVVSVRTSNVAGAGGTFTSLFYYVTK